MADSWRSAVRQYDQWFMRTIWLVSINYWELFCFFFGLSTRWSRKHFKRKAWFLRILFIQRLLLWLWKFCFCFKKKIFCFQESIDDKYFHQPQRWLYVFKGRTYAPTEIFVCALSTLVFLWVLHMNNYCQLRRDSRIFLLCWIRVKSEKENHIAKLWCRVLR